MSNDLTPVDPRLDKTKRNDRIMLRSLAQVLEIILQTEKTLGRDFSFSDYMNELTFLLNSIKEKKHKNLLVELAKLAGTRTYQ